MMISIWIVLPLLIGVFCLGAGLEARSTRKQIEKLGLSQSGRHDQ